MVYLATELEATLVKMKTSTDKEWAEFVSQKKEEKAALVSVRKPRGWCLGFPY